MNAITTEQVSTQMEESLNTQTNHADLTIEECDAMINKFEELLKHLRKSKRYRQRYENNKNLLALIAEERAAYEQKKIARGIDFKVSDSRHRDSYWIAKAKNKLAKQRITELEEKLAAIETNN
ncbi:MAG: hypothetical protein ACR2IJ_06090 [Fluviibacter sp.]